MYSLIRPAACFSLIASTLATSLGTSNRRAVAGQGWSLQASSCPTGSKSCGSNACCPSASFCQTTGNGEVLACCPTSSNCRGSVEGNPTCADAAWSLWKGAYGNGFCCAVGLFGAYRSGDNAAGICASNVPSGYSTAQLQIAGTEAPPTSVSSTTTAIQPTTSTASPLPSSSPTGESPRSVFAHYLVGTMTQDEAVKDIQDAKAAGFDAFALNTHDITSSWALNSIAYLFQAADANGFNLFMSFDMSWGTIQPEDIPSFLANYVKHKSYATMNGKPIVSTFYGGTFSNDQWQSGFRDPMTSHGMTPFFIPDFDNWSGWPNNFFSSFPVVDGAFSWESAWPSPATSYSNVSDAVDKNMMQQASAAGKVYMMPLSSFQFKYLGSGQDWYRVGDVNLPQRMAQILALQPSLVEFITWNDAGEGHYIGNVFLEQIAGSNIGDYANGFDHTGWQQLVTPFIKAYKAGATDVSQIKPPGATAVGALWYRTLLASASCSSTIQNYQQGQDVVNFAVLLPHDGYIISVFSNGENIGTFNGKAGLNYQAVSGLQAGSAPSIQVQDSNGDLTTASGTKAVFAQSSTNICNWNYEVVSL